MYIYICVCSSLHISPSLSPQRKGIHSCSHATLHRDSVWMPPVDAQMRLCVVSICNMINDLPYNRSAHQRNCHLYMYMKMSGEQAIMAIPTKKKVKRCVSPVFTLLICTHICIFSCPITEFYQCPAQMFEGKQLHFYWLYWSPWSPCTYSIRVPNIHVYKICAYIRYDIHIIYIYHTLYTIYHELMIPLCIYTHSNFVCLL